MPTYEYECTSCCFRFERRQHFHDDPVDVCPVCKAKSHRVFHSVPIVFKGSGFYTTDYSRSSSWNNKSKEQEPAAKSEEPKTEAKAETKAEVKAEAKD